MISFTTPRSRHPTLRDCVCSGGLLLFIHRRNLLFMNLPRPVLQASAPRILIIEDDDALRPLMADALSREGFAVETSADGITGLKIAASDNFDLVITDMIMPGKDGIETILELRQIAPRAKVIAISGGRRTGAGDFLPLARTLGAATLPKPFGFTDLIRAVEEALGHSGRPDGNWMALAG